jgi:hypothetical protein
VDDGGDACAVVGGVVAGGTVVVEPAVVGGAAVVGASVVVVDDDDLLEVPHPATVRHITARPAPTLVHHGLRLIDHHLDQGELWSISKTPVLSVGRLVQDARLPQRNSRTPGLSLNPALR